MVKREQSQTPLLLKCRGFWVILVQKNKWIPPETVYPGTFVIILSGPEFQRGIAGLYIILLFPANSSFLMLKIHLVAMLVEFLN